MFNVTILTTCTNTNGSLYENLHQRKLPAIPLSLPLFVKSGTGASLGRSISVDPASPRLHVILLV